VTTRRILLAVSTSRYSRHLVDTAVAEVEKARDEGHEVALDVLAIVETGDLERVSRSVGSEGFLGLGPQRDVLEALGREHDRMVRRRVEEVREAAAARDISVNVTEVQGTFVDTVIARAQELGSDVIVVTRADRPFISRILFGSDADKVARLAKRDGLGRVIIDE
jgi:nucleotide-binding universal stress UspA family protein